MKKQPKIDLSRLLKHPALTPMPLALRSQKRPISTPVTTATTGGCASRELEAANLAMGRALVSLSGLAVTP